jgi:hypothetical protein
MLKAKVKTKKAPATLQFALANQELRGKRARGTGLAKEMV